MIVYLILSNFSSVIHTGLKLREYVQYHSLSSCCSDMNNLTNKWAWKPSYKQLFYSFGHTLKNFYTDHRYLVLEYEIFCIPTMYFKHQKDVNVVLECES